MFQQEKGKGGSRDSRKRHVEITGVRGGRGAHSDMKGKWGEGTCFPFTVHNSDSNITYCNIWFLWQCEIFDFDERKLVHVNFKVGPWHMISI